MLPIGEFHTVNEAPDVWPLIKCFFCEITMMSYILVILVFILNLVVQIVQADKKKELGSQIYIRFFPFAHCHQVCQTSRERPW